MPGHKPADELLISRPKQRRDLRWSQAGDRRSFCRRKESRWTQLATKKKKKTLVNLI